MSSPKRRKFIDTTDSDNSNEVITDEDSASSETDNMTLSSDSESDLPFPPYQPTAGFEMLRTSEPRVTVKPQNKESQTHDDVNTIYPNPLNALANFPNMREDTATVSPLHRHALRALDGHEDMLRARFDEAGGLPVQTLLDLRELSATMKKAVESTKNVRDINTRLEPDGLNETLLIRAARTGETSVAKWLSGVNGVDINAVDINGFTALHHACFKGNTELVSVLLTRENIDVNAKDNYGQTPRRIASMELGQQRSRSIDNYLIYGVISNERIRDYESVIQMLMEKHAVLSPLLGE